MSEIQRSHLRVVRDSADAPNLPLPVDAERAEEVEPTQDFGVELELMVYEGEIVDDGPALRLPVRIAGRAVAVQPSPVVRQAAQVTAVAAFTVAQGWHSWAVRAADAATLGVYRRQIRAAEAAGDREALAEWVDRKEKAVHQRHGRLMDLPFLALNVAKTLGISLIGALVLLLALSTAVWATGVGSFGAVWLFVGGVIRLLLTVLKYTWFLLPVLALVAAWKEGRRVGTPTWLVGPADGPEGRDVIPDEGAILNALRKLGISELNKAFKEGWRPRFPMPTHRDGKGYRTQLELPAGVTVEMITKKKAILSHNLVRFPIEVWPTEPKAGVLDLWVADQGALSGPVDPWPLLHEGTVDYFKGTPDGVNIRGKVIIGRLSEANYALAGMMGSGKSTLIITKLLGAMLDPLVEIDVFVMAVNADYDPMKPRLRTLLTGTGDEIVERCLNTLREAYADLDVRGKALKEHGERAVTRALAEKDARLRPRIIVVDECQALFMHEEYGEEAVSLAVRLLNAARKYGYTLIFATPEPSSASLPRKLMAVISSKACFAIGDQQSNDAVLGTGSYTAGISAVGLEPKTDESLGDVGTCMAKGFEPKPALLRCFYVSQSEAKQVVERAMKIRELAGINSSAAVAVEESRDLLADLDEVLDEERVRLADIPGLLRKLAPAWHPYQGLTGIQLRDILTREYGVKVTNTGNVLRLDPADLRQVLAGREASE
ncbi:zonular occludens toxin domain-containing protein [Streptosporangium sp. NPDC005286]|uniref:zonular occludens toxin domain-containing protein n=1 Tax=Streptosporangium sp. NPDC005286 TaxID=3154463 RepID=UPI0033BA7E79